MDKGCFCFRFNYYQKEFIDEIKVAGSLEEKYLVTTSKEAKPRKAAHASRLAGWEWVSRSIMPPTDDSEN